MIGIFRDLLIDPERTRSSQIYQLHDWPSTTTRNWVLHFPIPPVRSAFIRVHPRPVLCWVCS